LVFGDNNCAVEINGKWEKEKKKKKKEMES
jgi:hypothetical protein